MVIVCTNPHVKNRKVRNFDQSELYIFVHTSLINLKFISLILGKNKLSDIFVKDIAYIFWSEAASKKKTANISIKINKNTMKKPLMHPSLQ